MEIYRTLDRKKIRIIWLHWKIEKPSFRHGIGRLMNLKRQNISSLNFIGKCTEPPDWANEAFLFGFVLQRLLNLEAPLSYENSYQIVGQIVTFPSALVQMFWLTTTLRCYLRLGSLGGGGEAILFIDLLGLHNLWCRFTEFHRMMVYVT